MKRTALKKYRKFKDQKEVEEWAFKHYSDIQNLSPDSEEYRAICSYTGSWYRIINEMLRTLTPSGMSSYGDIHSEDNAEEKEEIDTLYKVLCRYALPHPIVVYRATKKLYIKAMMPNNKLKKGARFLNKGFVSTTLLKRVLIPFIFGKKYNCILKIYLPEGFPGAYTPIKSFESRLKESEFTLPPNVTMEITKIHYFRFPLQIDCAVLPYEERSLWE